MASLVIFTKHLKEKINTYSKRNFFQKTKVKGTYSNSFPGANIFLIQKSEKDSKKTIEQHPSRTQLQNYLELLLNQIQRYILKKKQNMTGFNFRWPDWFNTHKSVISPYFF